MTKQKLPPNLSSTIDLSREDFSAIFADEIESTDVRYSGETIYKYYYFDDVAVQKIFFGLPTLKFAHKSELNDPFELSRRWSQFGCPFTEKIFDKYVRKRFESKLNNVNYMTAKFLDKARRQGVPLSRQQVRRILMSREGKAHIANAGQSALEYLDSLVNSLPQVFSEHEEEFIESFIRETGILSLTEDPISAKMWEKYAGQGRGFLVEFNAKHNFFSYADSNGKLRNVLRKVLYRDDRLEDFWRNPNYLFLVKGTKWEYEGEWRMIKSLADCRRLERPGRDPIYFMEMPTGIIRSITFGPLFSERAAAELSHLVLKYDGDVLIKQA
jgi:hypothetical protein